MAAWKDENVKKTRERLWHSLEMTYVKGYWVTLLVVEPLFPLIFLLRSGYHENFWKLTLLTCVIVAIPFLVFTVWQVVRMMRRPEGYIFCKTKLVNHHYVYWRRCHYFTVRMEDLEGRAFSVSTYAIFHNHGIAPPVLEDYVGSTVTIGYNEQTNNVVVIG